MDGADAVLIQMQGKQWQRAVAHSFLPYSDGLRQELLALQNIGENELHRSNILAQTLSRLYAQTVQQLLAEQNLSAKDIAAIGCHGQTIRHAPEHGYSIQLVNLPLLAELTGIFTIGDFRSRDLACSGQGAPLVPAFHEALFQDANETRAVLNIGGISNISILPPDTPSFGFDTGPGNMLMDAWMQHIWQQPYDKNGEKAAQGEVLPDLLASLLDHPYFSRSYPKSTGRELFSLSWLQGCLKGNEKTEDVNISTAEDPAEINLPGVNQVNVNEKQGLTFAAALRSFLRQDPDIIMVGEIRDLETADIAIKAAQTGHMVFSTLHTNNAPATLSRLLNMGVAPFNIASSVSLIMAQRLLRRLCPNCKREVERPPVPALKKAGFTDTDLAQDWKLYRPVGCDSCRGKGFKGRIGIYEVMPVSDEMQKVIMNNGTEVDIMNMAYQEGMVDLRSAGLMKVMQGLTSLEEVTAHTND